MKPSDELKLKIESFDVNGYGVAKYDNKVVFVIKKAIEKDFKEAIGDKLSKYCEVGYVFQDITKLPEGCVIPEGRVKPWGTAHAVLSAIDEIEGPFAVINADDYYGRDAFHKIFKFLTRNQDDDKPSEADFQPHRDCAAVFYNDGKQGAENASEQRSYIRDDVEKTCQKGYTDSCIEAYSDYEEQSEEIDETYSEHFQHDTREISGQQMSDVGYCGFCILFVLIRNKGSYHLAEQVAVLYKEETDEDN